MENRKYEYSFSPRFRDTDAYGVIHHSNYFCYFEEARYMYSRDVLGFQDNILDSSKFKFPVLKAECQYKKAIQYGNETYCVQTEFHILNNVKISFKYTLVNSDGEIHAIGMTEHAFIKDDGNMCFDIEGWFQKHMGLKLGRVM